MPMKIVRWAVIVLLGLYLGGSMIFFFTPIRNTPVWAILLVSAAMAVFVWLALRFWPMLRAMTRAKRISYILFGILFPLYIAASIRGEQPFLTDNHIVVILAVWLGVTLGVLAIVTAIIYGALSVRLQPKGQRVSVWKVLLYALPTLLVSAYFLAAFYPGAMTPDSLAQWDQALTHKYTDWHPVVHTMLLSVLLSIWKSPAIVAIFQILLISAAAGVTGRALEEARVPKWAIWLVLIVFAISPVHAISSITLWKDVAYSAALFLFSILMFKIVRTGGRVLAGWPFLALYALTGFMVMFFRHNGFPVFLIVTAFILIMYRPYWLKLFPVAAVMVLIYQIVVHPVYTKLEVHPSDPQEMLSIPTQQIAAIVTEGGDITDKQRDYVNRIFPIDKWHEKYNPYSVDSIKFSWGDYNRFTIYDDWGRYGRTYLQLVKQNPEIAAGALFRQTSLVWQINQPEDGYTSKYVTHIYRNNEYGLVNPVLNEERRLHAYNYLKDADESIPFLWRPAFYTALALLFTYIAYLRNNWRAWLLLLPVALNTGAVFVGIPAQDFRYLLANSMIMLPFLLISLVPFEPMEVTDDD
ncbi:DUF6020 family protein [Sporosarcina koreensis]|uniref:DUF6020 family protein n=2 Tax=Sporosarcina TaxID=1569 RepID=UPI001181AB2D|nr:DUF6020 family protein [Sporosarcina koreensis]